MVFQSPSQSSLGYRVAAAAKIFHDHGGFIRIVICSHIQDEDLAEDLFQDFFLSLISKPVPGRVQNVRGYLYRTITNDIVDATRRMMRYRANMREYAKRSIRTDSQQAPREALQQMEEAEMVLEFIRRRLPCTEAEAVSLHYLDDRKIKEIAKAMGVANATARAYIDDAVDKIRRLSRGLDAQVAE